MRPGNLENPNFQVEFSGPAETIRELDELLKQLNNFIKERETECQHLRADLEAQRREIKAAESLNLPRLSEAQQIRNEGMLLELETTIKNFKDRRIKILQGLNKLRRHDELATEALLGNIKKE